MCQARLRWLDACERRGTARFGHLPIQQDVEEPVGGNHGNDQTTLEILEVSGRLWGPCGIFETLGLDTNFFWLVKGLTLAVDFAYFSTADDAQVANQVKMAQFLGVYPLDSHAICSLLLISTWSLTSCGRLDGCRALVKRPTLSCRRWGTLAQQAVGESLTLLSSQILCNLPGGELHLSSVRHANRILVFVCTLRQLPHRAA